MIRVRSRTHLGAGKGGSAPDCLVDRILFDFVEEPFNLVAIAEDHSIATVLGRQPVKMVHERFVPIIGRHSAVVVARHSDVVLPEPFRVLDARMGCHFLNLRCTDR